MQSKDKKLECAWLRFFRGSLYTGHAPSARFPFSEAIMLNLTLRQLQVFEKAASHLNYSRAAEELYLSQPGVSMQIKQLEENIGLPLFEQMGKKIFLTEAGRDR